MLRVPQRRVVRGGKAVVGRDKTEVQDKIEARA